MVGAKSKKVESGRQRETDKRLKTPLDVVSPLSPRYRALPTQCLLDATMTPGKSRLSYGHTEDALDTTSDSTHLYVIARIHPHSFALCLNPSLPPPSSHEKFGFMMLHAALHAPALSPCLCSQRVSRDCSLALCSCSSSSHLNVAQRVVLERRQS